MDKFKYVIVAGNLTKCFGSHMALVYLNLRIKEGEIFGLLGLNGAGKTTFIRILLDLIRPTSGQIENQNVVVSESEEWKTFTGSFIDETFLIGYLTPEEYFDFIGDLRGMNKADVKTFLNQFEEFFNGEIVGKKKYLRDLSKGNQKKAGIVAAMMGNPEIVILDEPFANLDPTTQIRLKQIIKKLADDREISVLVSSHDLMHVTEVCERIVVLEKGEVIKDLKTSEATLKELEAHFASHSTI